MAISGYLPSGKWQWARFVFLLFALYYLVWASSLRNMGMFIWDADTQAWYTGGTCWLNGDSPYDRDVYTETWVGLYNKPTRFNQTFVYPPTMALLCVPLAAIPWPLAGWLFRFTNMILVAVICALTRRMMGDEQDKHPLLGPTGWYIGLVAFLSSITQGIFQGQSAIVVVFGCMLTWYAFRRKILWLFLIGFLIASIKPQISMIPLLYILFLGGVRWFSYGTALCALFSILVLVAVPIPDLLGTYGGSMENHLKYQEFNRWDWYCGVPALLGATPYGKWFMMIGVAMGALGVAWIAWRQRQVAVTTRDRIRHEQMVWVVAMAATPIHIYDLVGQAYIVVTLWVLPGWRRKFLAFAPMYFGNKAYSIADRFERYGGFFGTLEPLVRVQGMSIAAAFLLLLFSWWYYQDYGRRRATGAGRELTHD